jgi:transposase
VQALRIEFWEKIRNIRVEDLIFIDESGVNLAMVRLYARALKGKRAYGTRPQKRGKNVSMVGAITLKEVLTFFNVLGAIDGVTFEAFIIRKLVPKLWKGACVILDNCSVHKKSIVEKVIKQAGGQVIYLPPYSPDFSPIENCWSKVKGILRTIGARTYRALESAITQAYQQVSEQDLYNWFTHCCYCASSI